MTTRPESDKRKRYDIDWTALLKEYRRGVPASRLSERYSVPTTLIHYHAAKHGITRKTIRRSTTQALAKIQAPENLSIAPPSHTSSPRVAQYIEDIHRITTKLLDILERYSESTPEPKELALLIDSLRNLDAIARKNLGIEGGNGQSGLSVNVAVLAGEISPVRRTPGQPKAQTVDVEPSADL